MKGIFNGNMKILIFLSSIFAIEWSVRVSATTENPPPRSVNVALETSFLFEPKDINDNISFIKNIKVFLDKLYKILAPQAKQQVQQFRAEPERRFTFTDFIKDMGQDFLNFTGENLGKAIKILQIEVKKATEKGKEAIHELLPDKPINRYVHDSVGQWAKTDADALKEKIKNVMNENNPTLQKFAKRMNEYYDEEEIKKLYKIKRKLNRYLENKMDAGKVVKEFLHYGIVNKYKKLNETVKANLMNDMKLLSDYITANKKFKFKVQGANKASGRKTPAPIEFLIGDTNNVVEEPNDSEKDVMYDDIKKNIGKKLKKVNKIKEENNTSKKKGATNEIVVDNVELIVETLKKP